MENTSQATKEVIEALKPLAEKFGQSASQVFEYAVKQCFISGLQDILWFVFFLAGFVFFVRQSIGRFKNPEIDDDDVWAWLSGLLSVVMLVMVLVSINCAMSDFGNPEYQAISNILGMIIPKAK